MNQEEKQKNLLSRSIVEIIGKDELEKKLLEGKPLRIKFGIDPTSPNIHLGRAVPLLKLRDFQQAGHQIVFIIGDFTGTIGDTSDKESERPMLTKETVEKNLQSYFDQAGKLLDMSLVEKHYNSEWLEELTYRELCEQADVFSVSEFTARENIAKRVEVGKRVSLREMLYPMMQGYDSVAVKADVEIGGTDQRFNILAGRKLQEHYGQSPQNILLLELILGIDGRKMSSSWGNTVNLTDAPNEMFGKIMSLPDELIGAYFVHCTRIDLDEIKQLMEPVWADEANPRDVKLQLAKEIVRMYHGEDAAQEAEEYFVNTFSKHLVPEEISECGAVVGAELAQLLVEQGLATSKTDARRKIEQGGVTIASEHIIDGYYTLQVKDLNQVLKVGKKDFRRLIVK
ncbi:MAG: tyrosine--tRNA ligase [Candidatus Moraniibacteriota bacterium]